ncbi:MAG TPA: hypothetical protein VH481_07845 [Nitrososphaeraceae archaeon]
MRSQLSINWIGNPGNKNKVIPIQDEKKYDLKALLISNAKRYGFYEW